MSDSPQYTPVPPHAAQSGLSDNAAGALAYVTIIPAIVFLLVEPYNKNSFVRFHAWQCIFLGVCSLAIHLVLGIIPVIGWMILPFASLGILIVWLIALVKAFRGEKYQLPIIGKYAAQQAGA